jgi:mRNA-degrading endonuclease toxin of MazEF toxin-antitoxin module
MRGQLLWATVDGHARPWLIVQAEILNETAPTLLAVPVTLTPQQAGPDDTGFPQPSWARVTLLRALRREHLEEPIATLRRSRLDDITRALAAILGMEPTTSHRAKNYRDRERALGALSRGEERERVPNS